MSYRKLGYNDIDIATKLNVNVSLVKSCFAGLMGIGTTSRPETIDEKRRRLAQEGSNKPANCVIICAVCGERPTYISKWKGCGCMDRPGDDKIAVPPQRDPVETAWAMRDVEHEISQRYAEVPPAKTERTVAEIIADDESQMLAPARNHSANTNDYGREPSIRMYTVDTHRRSSGIRAY